MTVHPYRLYVRTNWDDGPDPTLVGTYRSEEEAEEALKLYRAEMSSNFIRVTHWWIDSFGEGRTPLPDQW
jgi:hypothetical protein